MVCDQTCVTIVCPHLVCTQTTPNPVVSYITSWRGREGKGERERGEVGIGQGGRGRGQGGGREGKGERGRGGEERAGGEGEGEGGEHQPQRKMPLPRGDCGDMVGVANQITIGTYLGFFQSPLTCKQSACMHVYTSRRGSLAATLAQQATQVIKIIK